MQNKKVLVIVAHADDMEFMAGGTVAKMIDKGMKVYQLITTNNEKGSFTIPKEELVRQSREQEAKVASKFLGLEEVIFLEYPDAELMNYPFNEIREKFMKQIRRIKPHIIMTWDPFAPYEPHQDHRTVGTAAMEAGEFAHLPLFYPEHREQGLEPHYVPEYLFFAKNPTNVNKVVDISEFIDKKISALLLHKSQMELIIRDIIICLESASIDPKSIGIDETKIDYKNLIDMGIKMMAGKAGQKAGFQYAEAFRYKGYELVNLIFPDLLKDRELGI